MGHYGNVTPIQVVFLKPHCVCKSVIVPRPLTTTGVILPLLNLFLHSSIPFLGYLDRLSEKVFPRLFVLSHGLSQFLFVPPVTPDSFTLSVSSSILVVPVYTDLTHPRTSLTVYKTEMRLTLLLRGLLKLVCLLHNFYLTLSFPPSSPSSWLRLG